jgi:hypothetical protein
MKPTVITANQRFNRVRIVKEIRKYKENGFRSRAFVVACDCGNYFRVELRRLKSGNVKSCGCYRVERAKSKIFQPRIHELSTAPLYTTWHNMMSRCYNPKNHAYPRYGGRGIKVFRAWKVLANFSKWCNVNGWCPELQLDRRDNDKGYSPNNCHFVPCMINCRNKTNNRLVTIGGESMAFAEAVDRYAVVNYTTALYRLNKGWSLKDSLLKRVRI